MKKRIKYKSLSKNIRKEIEKYHEKLGARDKNLEIEDTMVQWFNDCFEGWLGSKYAGKRASEKRNFFRLDIEIPVKIVDTLIESSEKDSAEIGLVGTILNISRGGLYFKSRNPIEPSTVVMTNIDLSTVDSELKNIEALAMVMRSEKIDDTAYGIGLMFSSIYDDHKENLDLFIFSNVAYHIHSI